LWPGDDGLALLRRSVAPTAFPGGTAKITFTSGTTGNPKGVCLDLAGMLSVAQGVAEATAHLGITRHLCALPFAVLLENVAGVLAPLLRGGTCVVLPLAEVGLTGSSAFDPAALHRAVVRHAAQSVILLPQMLRAWMAWLHAARVEAPRNLRLVAVGGAAVGARLLLQARALGLPAYEGYGLSEGSSVQTLNLPGADRPGSAGRVLPHARVRIGTDGEIEIGGALFLGYLGGRSGQPRWWRTGDLGELDAEGFLHVRGRRKNVLITAFGRNVSPEWVETALRAHPAIAQAAVFGEGEPALSAVLWPSAPDTPDTNLDAAVAAANAELPDYARVLHWVRARAPFDASSGMATANGRPRRNAIHARHRVALKTCSRRTVPSFIDPTLTT
jgi:long-subunit acyl-CoA synthetase (AMP-forming)